MAFLVFILGTLSAIECPADPRIQRRGGDVVRGGAVLGVAVWAAGHPF